MPSLSGKVPHLVSAGTTKQLVVNGKPFLMLPGELQNSSPSSAEYMDTVWQRLVDGNFNTLLSGVTWEQIEPVEGHFNFEELDKVILGARKHGLRLVLLWFGSIKNALATYAPAWVKIDSARFPRAKLREARGVLKTTDALSIFTSAAREADAKAFAKLMGHVKEVDEEYSTVIMVQVENEVGILGDSRDASTAANDKFTQSVPEDLLTFLSNDWDYLHPSLKKNLSTFRSSSQTRGSESHWDAVFGKSLETDELFMAYHHARYVDYIAASGKAVYALPMYTNCWMRADSVTSAAAIAAGGVFPGVYPSGGPAETVLDIWQQFSPNLDFHSPDIYSNDYITSCANYRHRNQALFIPEQRRDEYGARRIWAAYGSYAALGTAPFGVDTMEPQTNPFTKHYELLGSVSTIVLEAQRRPGSSIGFFFDEIPEGLSARELAQHKKPIVHIFGGYELTIERVFVFGKQKPACGMVIRICEGKFLLIGWGFQVSARSLDPDATFTGILSYHEKIVEDRATGKLLTGKLLNGDENRGGLLAMMPSEEPDYGNFHIPILIPARTMIAELEVYYLKD